MKLMFPIEHTEILKKIPLEIIVDLVNAGVC
jgi:hypothetical protein